MTTQEETKRTKYALDDIALLEKIADERIPRKDLLREAQRLLERHRRELPSTSVAAAAQILDVSRTTVEAWRTEGILAPATGTRRHEVTIESLGRARELVSELRRIGKLHQIREYAWWRAQDAADYGQHPDLTETLRQARDGHLTQEYTPSAEALKQARQLLAIEDKESGP